MSANKWTTNWKSNVPEAERILEDLFPGAARHRAHQFAAGMVRISVDFEMSVDEYSAALKSGHLHNLIARKFGR